jgi:predicted dinucleotide-binding enzyme
MKVGVLGTGSVGIAISSKLIELGHEVTMGSRDAHNETALEWASRAGEGADYGSFADAASFGELVFNCTAGAHSLEALNAAGASNLSGKILIDVSNALDHSTTPMTLTVANTDSIAEQVQRAFPDARVVKSLNTMNCNVMVDPASVPGDHVVFVCGNDDAAKAQARALLAEIGWPEPRIVDLGDLTAARGTEMYVMLWVRLMQTLGGPQFNISLSRSAS